MPNKIKFRQEALKHLSSPEQLDQLIRVVSPRSWIIAGTLYLILFIIILWSIFGTIPTRLEGEGILLAGGGNIFNAVAPDGPGHVEKLLVKAGDKVKKGEVVATLSRPDLTNDIQVAQSYLEDLQQKQKQLLELSESEIKARQKDIQEQKDSLQRVLISSQKKHDSLGALLKIRQEAFKKGIETRQNVEQTLQEFYRVESEIEGYNDKLVQLNITLSNFNDQWRERLRDLALKIIDNTQKLNQLQTRLGLSLKVKSPVNGVVIDIRATVGSIINVGAPLVSIANEGKDLDALIFLPPKSGKRIKIGMQAFITPNTIEKAEYGSILGTVINVSEFPETSEAMTAALQNENLVKQFSKEEVPIAVRIHLTNDATTFSGLQWSSSSGPLIKITPGTLVRATIRVRNQAPITLVIPALKEISGIE